MNIVMDLQINQFVSEQREIVEMDNGRDRERRRDRDRRSDRDRDRDRDGRRRHRDRRDHSRERERRSRESDYSRSRDRRSAGRDPIYNDNIPFDDNYYRDSYSNDDQGSNYGDADDRYPDDYKKYHSRDTKAADKWITLDPTNTVILKGLPPEIDEKDIKAQLMMTATPVREVRLVRDKITGGSRGFAFVEFQSVGDAQQWMEQNQGRLFLLDQYQVNMYYSTPKVGMQMERGSSSGSVDKTSSNPLVGVIGDWICTKCGVHNFKRREHCFKCTISREESERGKEGDGYDQVGHNPCNTLVLRGLDALTLEDSLTAALSKFSALPIKNIKVIKDEATGVSKSYAFVEMNSIADSTELVDTVSRLHGTLEIDGKAVMVNYAKNTFSTVMATMAAQKKTPQSGYYGEDGQYYDSSYYAQYDYSQYYNTDGTTVSSTGSGTTQTDSTNAAAAVAQAAIHKAQAAKAIQKRQESMQKQLIEKMHVEQVRSKMSPEERIKHEAQEWVEHTGTTDEADYPQYPVPDVSTYQFDESSGYYYDPTTGLYYDASSQYYYNSTTGQFMYWDGEKKTYLPAPSDAQSRMEEQKDGKKEGKRDKVKVAKKIAKDMEKWAKTLNSQKEAQRDAFKKMFQPMNQKSSFRKETATADAGFAILEKSKKEDTRIMPPPPLPQGGKSQEASGLVPSYGDDSDNESEEEQQATGLLDESRLADYSKLACLLCKRQFSSREILQKHIQLSDLHKKNLEELRRNKAANSDGPQEMDSVAMTIQYRDRARERRQKYGAPAPPVPKKTPNYSVPLEQPTTRGIGKDNKGSKLLQKMGWNEGQGLGKSGQGIVDPVQASQRTEGAGLGVLGSTVERDPNDTYKQSCKKVMMARFNAMD